MKPTSPLLLGFAALFMAAASLIVQLRYFAYLERSWWDLLFPWALTAICVFAANWVRSVIKDKKVGQDRSQVQPTVLAAWLIVGTASAWLGAVVGGIHAGGLIWALPNWSELAVAAEQGPIMAVGAVSGFLLAGAGLWLEKECQLPPDDENSGPPTGDRVPPSVGWEA